MHRGRYLRLRNVSSLAQSDTPGRCKRLDAESRYLTRALSIQPTCMYWYISAQKTLDTVCVCVCVCIKMGDHEMSKCTKKSRWTKQQDPFPYSTYFWSIYPWYCQCKIICKAHLNHIFVMTVGFLSYALYHAKFSQQHHYRTDFQTHNSENRRRSQLYVQLQSGPNCRCVHVFSSSCHKHDLSP